MLIAAGEKLGERRAAAEDARRALVSGAEALDEGWDGLAADAVLGAVEGEKDHVTRLTDGLEDLADTVRRAHAALGPAVQSVRDRIGDAEAAGLAVTDTSIARALGPGGGRGDQTADQRAVDLHAEAINSALDTVRSLDEHFGREIDEIASRLHHAIPPKVDRSPIPGPDDPWPARGVDAMTGAMGQGYPALAAELDPETRGKHKLNPAPDDFGRNAAKGLRVLGKAAGPLGTGLTLFDGMKAHAEGKTSTGEAIVETTGAVVGGAAGGAAAGAVAGTFFGPVGTLVGAGVGAVVGTYLGQKAGDEAHERFFDERPEG
ncbi:hypothetical protein [Dietzia alimentaria]|uniref:hypothetical protein n=1 Tax=Dietzia alimentaria TaxID=665550 RepID=UPI0002D65A32|nr:hypothetical protein [Dietzia alimentaria]